MITEKQKALIKGIDQFHYGLVTKNDSTGYESEKMKHIEGLNQIQISFNSVAGEYYGDNMKIIEETNLTGASLTINIASIPENYLAEMLGQDVEIDEQTGRITSYTSVGDTQQEICVGFRVRLSTGEFVYYKFYVGRAQLGDETLQTADSNINYTDQTLTINCVPMSFEVDGKYRLRKKEKSETVIEDFFDAETLPSV